LLPYFKDKLFDEAWESKNRGDDYFAKEFSFDVKNNFWKHAFQHSDYRQLPDEYKKIILESQSHGLAWAWAENSAIMIPSIQGDLPSDDQKKILIRFAKVFEQSFIRFLDLQKAEEQAREAKIEAALEKVRSRSLAMHKSDELNEVVKVLFEKMTELEVPSTAVAIQTFSENSKDVHCFVCGDVGTGIVISQYLLPYFDHPILEDFHKAREKKLELYVGTYSKKEKDSFYDVVLKLPELKDLPAEVNSMIRESEVYEITMVPAKKSVLTVNDFYGNRLSDGQVNILKRFAKVFDQAYTRFLDLQKAEAQNRQAQINLALERVRARSLAMQKPDDLNKVNEELLRQLQELHIDGLSGVSIWLIDKEGLITAWDLSNPGNMRDPRSATLRYDATKFDLIGEPWRIFNSSDMDYVVLDYPVEKLRKAVKEWAEVDTSIADEFQEALDNGSLTHQWNPLARHSHGFLSIDLVKHPSDGIREIVTKMAGVFSLAYRRFLDLQKAEEQAREAQIELSLERIRSQVTAMQESSDLLDIVVTMRTEFVNLGHEAQYFWHMRWLTDHYKKAMTSGDGTKIGMVMTLPRHIHGNIESVAKWEKSNESTYVLAMEVDEAVDYIDKMITLGDFEKVDPQAPTLDDIRHIGGLTFIMARTTHGEIGYSLPGVVPNPPTDALDTLVSFAGVFDLAYKRFEDLKAAEQQALLIREERDRLEVALKELHATQDQLVQQEKLASLGQLTAGIAHEIKNPLNFVNNFSELSAELIQEVREEIESVGAIHELPLQDVYDILDDIEANLTTIHKHGSRADSIVKSMLEHSRGGSGKMEPTDLNSLLKEYVNLSFHGMRAGKDPINVDLQFDLDESVTEVPLIAEDFSRVIINLSNNAFDAMRSLSAERSANDKDYKPKLTIRTHQIDSGTTIEIEDNGGGIPNELKGKILQPFFTTKKGTEGTGLGLSITNDIIKAHKGTLDVRSSENGSIFTIHLPIH
jgi:signal transduction histidine kinase